MTSRLLSRAPPTLPCNPSSLSFYFSDHSSGRTGGFFVHSLMIFDAACLVAGRLWEESGTQPIPLTSAPLGVDRRPWRVRLYRGSSAGAANYLTFTALPVLHHPH